MAVVASVGGWLGQGQPRELTDAIVRPGWLGLLVFLGLAVASYLLFRSMNRQLKKVDFVEEPITPPAPPTAPPEQTPPD